MLAVGNRRQGGRLGAIARTAAQAGAYIAARAASGAVQGAGQRAYAAGQRYFQGDVNQPASAKTVQTVVPLRQISRARGRSGRRGGSASITEGGTMKIADIAVSNNAGYGDSGKSLLSFPLQVENIGGRLFEISKLYSRWKLVKAVLRYVPSVSSATDGGLVIYYTQEPDDTYELGEAVGAGNASSAIDNIEFSVREKANLSLHVPSQQLFCTPSPTEKSWHCAGIINVVSNGSLTLGKTYGSLYMDFVANFAQPCAPYDVFSPMSCNASIMTPSGPGSLGQANGSIFYWTSDASKLIKTSGSYWTMDRTGRLAPDGTIYMPPLSSVLVCAYFVDANTVAGMIKINGDTGVNSIASSQDFSRSTDKTVKTLHALMTNTNSYPAFFTIYADTAGMSITNASLALTIVPYTAS